MNAHTPIEAPIERESGVRLAGSVSRSEAELYFHALRSRLLNEFAVGEQAMDETIDRLCAEGRVTRSAAMSHRLADQRMLALQSLLSGELAGRRHVAAACDRLDRWQEALPVRNALAHGVMNVVPDSASPGGWIAHVSWFGRGSGNSDQVNECWDLAAFGEVIKDIETQAQNLRAQLGQIGRMPHKQAIEG